MKMRLRKDGLGGKTFFLLSPMRANEMVESLGDANHLWQSTAPPSMVDYRSWYGAKGLAIKFPSDNGSGPDDWMEPVSGSFLHMPFRNKQRWTVLSFFQTASPIATDTNDPRIFSKDIGSGETDHTFMIGYTGSGATARCRIGFGGNRCASGGTLLCASNNITANQRFVIAATYDGATLRMHSLRWDGNYTTNSAARSGDVTYNTDGTKLGRNAGVSDNHFNGWVECILGVDHVLDRRDLTKLMYGDWRAELLGRPRITLASAPLAGGGGGGDSGAYHRIPERLAFSPLTGIH